MRDNAKSGALTEVTFYILLSLYTPKQGYDVMQFVEEKTGGRLSLGAGTLYGALKSLQEKKWIEPYGCLLYTSFEKKSFAAGKVGAPGCSYPEPPIPLYKLYYSTPKEMLKTLKGKKVKHLSLIHI